MSKIDSRVGLLEREQEVMKILNLFLEKKLDFVVVGGYAISTYKKRFSIDLDVVVSEKDLEEFEKILEKEGYTLHYEKEIALLYGENFKRFRKNMKDLPVDIDLLINGLVSRTTNATWGLDYIKRHSINRKLSNSEFLTPEKELLIAMKFHSGRLSDIRDIVALMPCNLEKLKKHIQKGDIEKLKESIKKQFDFLNKPQFDDSFKGIFGPYSFNEKEVRATKEIIKEILEEDTKKLKEIPFRSLLLTQNDEFKDKVKDKKPKKEREDMTNKNNGSNLGFEQKMWQAADKLRSNMDAAEYKHVVLGLIFLKYISFVVVRLPRTLFIITQ